MLRLKLWVWVVGAAAALWISLGCSPNQFRNSAAESTPPQLASFVSAADTGR